MNKVALITGSSRGIGHSIALKFASNGYNVIINCRYNQDKLMDLKEEIISKYKVNCLAYVKDISIYQQVEDMFVDIYTHYDTIDVIVNNAGIAHMGLFADLKEDEWDQIININLKSIYNICKHSIPTMVRHQKGHILNISSIWGGTGASCEVAYSASKGGVNSLTKALAKELAPSHIYVNAIACGVIDTDMNNWLDQNEKEALEEAIPMGRMGTSEEVANLTYFLAEGSPNYLTGQVITLDGGML